MHLQARDMIPIVYSDTMKEKSVIFQLQKEHEEIQKKHAQNPGTQFSDIAQKYYEKKDKNENEEHKRKIMSQRLQKHKVKSNFLPSCKAVKRRMDSQHLNSCLVRSEIKYAAERQLQFKGILEQASPTELEDYRSNTAVMSARSTLMKQHPQSTKNRATPNIGQSRKTAGKPTGKQPNEFVLMQSPSAQNIMECFQQQSASAFGSKLAGKRKKSGCPLSTTASTTSTHAGIRSSFKQSSTPNLHQVQRLFSTRKHTEQAQIRNSTAMMPSVKTLRNFKEIQMAEGIDDLPNELENKVRFIKSDLAFHKSSPSRIGEKSGLGHLKIDTRPIWHQCKIQSKKLDTADIESSQAVLQQAQLAIQDKNHLAHQRETLDEVQLASPLKEKQSYSVIVNSGRKPQSERQSEMQLYRNKEVTNRFASSQGSQDDLNQTPISFTQYSSSSKLQQQTHVYNDLVELADQEGRVQNLFKSARNQSEKDALFDSMNHHMRRHRPRVQITQEQERKRTEYSCRFLEGNQLLQKRLSQNYGIPDVEMPPECKLYLPESTALQSNKKKQDDRMRQTRQNRRNFAITSTFETLNRSTTHCNPVQIVSSARLIEPSSSVTTLEKQHILSQQQNTHRLFSEVPLDPKPDVPGMTADRIDQVKENLVVRISEKQNVPKTLWRKKQAEKNTDEEELQDEENQLNTPANKTADHTLNSTANLHSSSSAHLQQHTARSPTRMKSTVASGSSNLTMHKEALTFEAETPGIGGPARGKRLKKFTSDILIALDIEIVDTVYEKPLARLSMPECEREAIWLRKHFKDIEGSDFWQQKGLICSRDGKADAAMDYYRQGLRKNPTTEALLYSLALSYLQLHKYDSAIRWFSHGLKLIPRWIDGLCGVAVAFFNMQNYEKALQYIELAKNNFKSSKNKTTPKDQIEGTGNVCVELPAVSKLTLNTITLIQAMSMKETGRLNQACNVYLSLEEIVQRERSKSLVSLLWGCILVPLQSERRTHADHYRNLQEQLEHIKDDPIPGMDLQNLLLSRYLKGAFIDKEGLRVQKLVFWDYKDFPKTLDFEQYSESIWTLLRTKSFFKRFNNLANTDDKILFKEIMTRSQVELYKKNQPICLHKRVGIVSMGSCEIRSHPEHSLLKPYVIKKAVEGDILGTELNEDAPIMLSPLTWIMSQQEHTEVVFFSPEDFKKLFNMQRKFTEQFLVLIKLNQNKFFRQLNRMTKFHLVFECLDLKNFYPGQLLLSVHKRSPISPCFKDLFADSISKFRMQIDFKILRLTDKHSSVYQGFIKALNSEGTEETLNNTQSVKTRPTSPDCGQPLSTMYVEDNRMDCDQGHTNASLIASSLSNAFKSLNLLVQPVVASQDGSDARKRRLNLLIQAKQQAAQSTDEEIQSNSTDYGVEHCHQLMNEKEIKKGVGCFLNNDQYLADYDIEVDGEEMAPNEDKEDVGKSYLDDLIGSECPDLLRNPLMDSSLEREMSPIEAMARPKSQSPKKKKLIHSATMAVSFMSPNESVAHNITSFSTQNRGRTMKMQNRAILINKSTSPTQPKGLSKKFAKTMTMAYEQLPCIEEGYSDIDGISQSQMTPFKNQQMALSKTMAKKNMQMSLEQLERFSISPKKPPAAIPQMKIAYNFLFQRYIDQIEADHEPMKKEIKLRKEETKHMLKFVTGLSQMLMMHKTLTNIELLEKELIAYSKQFKAGHIVFEERSILEGSSGFWNAHIIDHMNKNIELIIKSVSKIEDAQDIILKHIVDECDSKYAKQLDPEGIHFIAAGDAFILGPDGTQNMKLHTNDCFGQSDFVKMAGPEYFGNVRAGLAPVQTYYLSIADLKRRISIPEKLKMYAIAGMDHATDAVIKSMERRDNIEYGDKLRHY